MAFARKLQARRQRERDNSVAGQLSPELHRVCQLRLCRNKNSQAAGEVSHDLDSGRLREAISPGWEGVRAGLVSLSDLSWSGQQEPVTRGALIAASGPGTGHRYHDAPLLAVAAPERHVPLLAWWQEQPPVPLLILHRLCSSLGPSRCVWQREATLDSVPSTFLSHL
jgi:hypothetical protein